MKRTIIVTALLLSALLPAAAQHPLCLVNGTPTENIDAIPPEDIEQVEMLPADEQTIARYGEEASEGVLLITLRYDRPAAFAADTTFGSYIARQVRWDDDEPAARVILRYKVTPDGRTVVVQELESTDNRLKRRVLKAVEEAPNWQPAQKNGVPVESEGVLSIQLPEGKALPRPVELVYR
ncbi:energy transducer TonB [Alistipes sp.]|uniref:energy transducer TonB n=1 Tax=Alistipes sp. TaxID=1872444 RepID=UPI003AEFDB84